MSGHNRKRSALWNHFNNDNDNKKAKCSYCSAVISLSGGSVGNLGRHLKTKHPTVSIVAERQPIPQETIEEHGVEIEVQPGPSSALASVGPTSQPTMNEFVSVVKPLLPRRSELLDEQLAIMIAKEYHPLRIVEETEFRNFLHMLCPGYSLPTRKTLTDNIIKRIYEKIKTKVHLKLSAATAVCLTIDGWSSINNESFLSITAHFIVSSERATTLESVLINCVEYTERHTSDNLCEFILSSAREWQIDDKITAIASDNAANITAAIVREWRHVACFAHTLNLLVKEAIKHIYGTVLKVKTIVEYFKRSAHAQLKLKELQKQMNLPELKLKQDVATRWNSTYCMLSRILKIKDAVVAAIALLRIELSLSENDWNVIEASVSILEKFNEVTEEISAEKNVSLSKVIPLCWLMRNSVKNCLRQPSFLPEVTQLLTTLDSELERRFGSYEKNTLYAEATILDPRFKNRGFQESRYERGANTLKARLASIRPTVVVAVPPTPSSTNSKPTIWGDFDREIAQLVPENATAAGIVEFDKYIQEVVLDRKKDPLLWWHERKLVYPMLFNYVKKRLNIVACERIFSKAGYTLTERRTRLRTKLLSQILLINSNAE